MQFISHASGSAGNLYQVAGRPGDLIIEAGIAFKHLRRALNFGLSSIHAALISHYHADHCRSVRDVMRAGIDCCMSAETAAALNLNGHRVRILEPLKHSQIAGWSVVGFPTQHDTPGAMGFLVSDGEEKLLYATDTFYIHYQFKGLNIIAVECNYSRRTLAPDLNPVRKQRLYKSHFSLENVKKFLSATDLSAVREIHLIHMSRRQFGSGLVQVRDRAADRQADLHGLRQRVLIDIVILRDKDTYHPFSEEDRLAGRKYPEKRPLRARISGARKMRSYRELCAYFGSCQYIANLNLDEHKNTKKKVDYLTRIKLGFVEETIFDAESGELYWIVKHLDYDSCDQPDAHAFISQALEKHAQLAGCRDTDEYLDHLEGIGAYKWPKARKKRP